MPPLIAHRQRRVQLRSSIARPRAKAHDHVRVLALRANELRRHCLATLEHILHLTRRVAALRGVARDLPPMAQRLRRVEIHAHVVSIAQRLRVEAEQPLHDQKLRRRDLRGASKSPVA